MSHQCSSQQKAYYLLAKVVLGSLLLWLSSTAAGFATNSVRFTSHAQPIKVLEVYSSQGCSSCPPAERWVSQFVDSPALFTQVFPLVFHVDYWDYIGWSDPFASAQFSQRQQLYKQKGAIGSVYTPGFVVNGKEWKGWFAQPSSTRALLALPGIANPDTLHVALKGNTLAIEIQDIHGESNNVGDKYTNANLNIAVLGMGLSTPVTRGENARQTLVEDFVVLEFLQFHWPLDQSLTLNLPSTLANAPRYAVVVFLSESNNQRPLLAAGGLLPTDWQW
ncbi:MAG: DUF1223 domain-containing protein [Paraglaciecola sp.]|nr:DUF1223 domain-containing protein [Paraglaciecola sp.]NCT48974.1 DUF1223 domain-containing protein [Paraglaciecola sp.]